MEIYDKNHPYKNNQRGVLPMIVEHSIRRFKFNKLWMVLKIALVGFALVVLIGSATLYLLAYQTVEVYEGGIYPEDSIIIRGTNPKIFENLTKEGIYGMKNFTSVEILKTSNFSIGCNNFKISSNYIYLLGVKQQYFSMFSIEFESGRAIKERGEIVMGHYVFHRMRETIPGFGIGSEIKIKNPYNNETMVFKVVGVVKQQRPDASYVFPSSNTVDTLIFLPLSDFHHLFENFTENIVIVKPESGKGLVLYYQLSSKFNYVEYPGTVKFRNAIALSWLSYFLGILSISTLLSVAVAIFASAVSQIRHSEMEFGVLKSSGVSSTKIFMILLLESFYLMGVALIIAFLLGGIFIFSFLSLSNLGLSFSEILLYTIGFPILIIFLVLLIYPLYGVIYYRRITAATLLRVT